jgi:NAD(P)-dependent dehydrogenase (short-subunit alcohol dehydrogenase family)
MTIPLARELAQYGIRVLAVAPGVFETPMTGALPDNVRQNLINTVLFFLFHSSFGYQQAMTNELDCVPQSPRQHDRLWTIHYGHH